MAGPFNSVWFRVGLFVALLLLIALKFWWSRRKYVKELAERRAAAEQGFGTRPSMDRHSVGTLITVENSNQFQSTHPGRNMSPLRLPPPEFDDAIKFCEKVDIEQEDEPPPSYTEYINTISAGDGDSHESHEQRPPALEIPSVHSHVQKKYDKESAAASDSTMASNLPEVANHL